MQSNHYPVDKTYKLHAGIRGAYWEAMASERGGDLRQMVEQTMSSVLSSFRYSTKFRTPTDYLYLGLFRRRDGSFGRVDAGGINAKRKTKRRLLENGFGVESDEE
ncbi:RpiR family transcriptional regulator [Striga asiatica]|uniref:RpiR family transcriptional regulator n=1 Tax=Striga asiatica TaxID=4170 RepID=A0A5A7P955_STRAF|nr:RpiR family transcriptional regulator [Striga asiatica]